MVELLSCIRANIAICRLAGLSDAIANETLEPPDLCKKLALSERDAPLNPVALEAVVDSVAECKCTPPLELVDLVNMAAPTLLAPVGLAPM